MLSTSLVGIKAALYGFVMFPSYVSVSFSVVAFLPSLSTSSPLSVWLSLSFHLSPDLLLSLCLALQICSTPRQPCLTLFQHRGSQPGWARVGMPREIFNSNMEFPAAGSRLGLNMGESQSEGRVLMSVALPGWAREWGAWPDSLLEEGDLP